MKSPLAAVRRFLADAPYRRLPDDALWARFRDHADGDALRLFLQQVGGRVEARCRAVTGDAALAEDALQDALVQLVTHRRRVRGYAQAVAWLYRAADRQARMLVRRRTRSRRREEWAARPEPVSDRPPTDFEAVAAAVAGLPERERRAVELVYLEGMTHEEAAAALGLGRGAVGTYVSRGVKRLRDRLGPAGFAGALATGGLAPDRVAALTAAALARGTAARWLPAKLAAWVIGLGLLAGGAGWMATRGPEPPETVVAPPPAAPESVPERTLRLFHSDVLPDQLAAVDGLVAGGGRAELAGVVARDTRLVAEYRLPHRLAGVNLTSRLVLKYDTAVADRRVYFALDEHAPPQIIDQARPIVLWRNPFTRAEVTVQMEPLTRAVAVLDRLPRDDRATAEYTTRPDTHTPSRAPYREVWLESGDPARVYKVIPRDGGDTVLDRPDQPPVFAYWIDRRNGPDGWPDTVQMFGDRAVRSADGRRIDDPATGRWWVRAD